VPCDSRRPAHLGSCEDRAGRGPSRLDPADGNDGVADDAMPVVEVERQRDVFRTVAMKIAREASCLERAVNPASQGEPWLEDGVWMTPALSWDGGRTPGLSCGAGM
jgi:hypothetical protein